MTNFGSRLQEHATSGRLNERWKAFVQTVQQETRGAAVVDDRMAHGHGDYSGDRSTRTRWLHGDSLPRCAACVRALAAVLEDEGVLSAWAQDCEEANDQRKFNDAATRVSGLPPEMKRKLQEQLEHDIESATSEATPRELLRIDVEIASFTRAMHRGEVSLRWRGSVPANAKVSVVSDRDSLNAAFADQSCIYRDLLHLGEEQLAAGYEQLAEHEPGRPAVELGLKRDGRPWSELTASQLDAPGCFEFDNEAVDEAAVRLRVTFPYPTEYTCYPVQFGSYQVSGVADVSMRLTSGVAQRQPKLLVFPPDRETRVEPRTDALSIELGEAGAVLPTGTTVFFYWTADVTSDRLAGVGR